MNYLKGELIIPIALSIVGMTYLWYRSRRERNEFIFNTWFKRTTKINRIRFYLKLLGFSLLLISLLDFRGPEEKIESNIPDQKTIIIIDSSASMLAEDVRPNRYEKSILMARHLIKKAFGHRIAVVLFSDTQKRLVPFTDDLDLLDARVAGLASIRNYDGGSNVSQAIRESLGYFRVEKGAGADFGGNILVFTDSEGHDDAIDFKLPDEVSLAIVGVGTLKGARIPNRDRYNTFRGYKKYEGKEVFTKLNEDWLKSLSSKVATYKYWIANSYSIPTEQILAFFNSNFSKKINKGSATVRPVKAHLIILPALILLIISFALYPSRGFVLMLLLSFFIVTVQGPTLANDEGEEETEVVLGPETSSLLQAYLTGGLDKKNKIKLAEMLLRDGDYSRSVVLYKELGSSISPEALNNYAVSLLKAKRPIEAIRMFSDVQYSIQDDQNIDANFKSELRQNLLLALQQKKEQEKQKKKKEQENKDQKKKKDDGKGDGSPKKDPNGEKGKSQKKSQGDKDGKKKKNQKQENKKDKKGEEKEGKKKEKKTLAQQQKEIEKKRKMIKVPGLIKQILSDDRNLQKRYLDTSTQKPKARKKKDW